MLILLFISCLWVFSLYVCVPHHCWCHREQKRTLNSLELEFHRVESPHIVADSLEEQEVLLATDPSLHFQPHVSCLIETGDTSVAGFFRFGITRIERTLGTLPSSHDFFLGISWEGGLPLWSFCYFHIEEAP